MPSAGAASASRATAAVAPQIAGRATTRRTSAAHSRDGRAAARPRPRNGIRPRSARGPSQDSSAGSTVERAGHRDADHRDRAERDAGEHGRCRSGTARPCAIITVTPDTRIARPDVPAAIRSDSGERPSLGSFLTLAAQVEQRVVDADRHPDDQHHLGRVESPDRQPVARDRHQRQGRHHRGSLRAGPGCPAATRAPKTTSSRISVIGIEVASAWRKSSELSIARSGCSRHRSRRRADPGGGPARRRPLAGQPPRPDPGRVVLPGTSNVTRALRPSADTSGRLSAVPGGQGERRTGCPAADFGSAARAVTTCRAACRMLASPANV